MGGLRKAELLHSWFMSLRIRKLDLHTHTPASHDFADKAVTGEQIVKHAISRGLDGMAVTDHNTVDFIDSIQAAAKGTPLTIFPGIEISCGGTQEGCIHVLALFDPTKTKANLERVLGRLEIRGHGEDALTNKGVNDVIDIISGEGGIPVLAHANSTHGALNDIRGNPRTEVVKNPRLLAAEATAGDFEKAVGKRLVDILDGSDQKYQRKLAVYQASDNPAPGGGHSLNTIGSIFTYFKMGEMTLESIRQCFEDPDARIVQRTESEKLADTHPRLETLTIDGGFLADQRVPFSANMNSIIGGTGTGKSLIIEFLRFALNKPPTQTALLNDHKEKLQKQLRMHSAVVLTLRDGNSDEYEISRELTSTRDPYESPLRCRNKTTGTSFSGDIASIFPTLIYSQNEILEITRDQKAQLELLENFKDFSVNRVRTSETVDQLKMLDLELIKCRSAAITIDAVKKELSTVEEQLKKAERALKGKIDKQVLDKYVALKKERDGALEQLSGFDELETELSEIIGGLKDRSETWEIDADTSAALTKEISAELVKTWRVVIASTAASAEAVVKAKARAQERIIAWEKKNKFEEVERAYKAEIKKKGILQEKEGVRNDLAERKQKCEQKLKKAQRAVRLVADTRARRQKLFDELASLSIEYSQGRIHQAELITSGSNGRLRIAVSAQSDTSRYSKELLKLKVGSRAEKADIEGLIQKVAPRRLVDLVLDGDWKTLSKEGGISDQMARNVIAELTKEENLAHSLALPYLGQAEDQIEIKYLKRDGNYYPIAELSMGQKADALIMIALGDSAAPVIIDQPEDALDIPSIWTDICSRIRPVKYGRQFIFTTHNSSISVASDSDQFTVLEADGTRGWVARTGSIDQKQVREDIVDHLEGGPSSYDLKRRKYGFK